MFVNLKLADNVPVTNLETQYDRHVNLYRSFLADGV